MASSILKSTFARATNGLKRWPSKDMWPLIAAVFIAHGVFAGGFGFLTGLYRFEPNIGTELLRVAIIALFVPAIGEEVFFRAALIPEKTASHRAFLHMAAALVAFLAWHPINAILFFPQVLPLFSDWRFLTVTASLGIACTYLWRATGSLWPSIGLHWLVVIIWKALLGAPRMM